MSICDAGARVDSSGLAFKGSMIQLQLYVNERSKDLGSALGDALEINGSIKWVSPLAADHYAEYRDNSFLEALGFGSHTDKLTDFWPRGGPCWDALGLVESSGRPSPILVEAKSYPREGYSSISAKSPRSLDMIEGALAATASWLGLLTLPPTWTDGRYQVANRLAHFYFLSEVLGLSAYLVFVMFIDDPTHHATSRSEWEAAIPVMWEDMGLSTEPPNTAVVYLPGLQRSSAGPV